MNLNSNKHPHYCCLLCNRSVSVSPEEDGLISETLGLGQRFALLSCRYLNFDTGHFLSKRSSPNRGGVHEAGGESEEDNENGFLLCGKCGPTAKSFCDGYEKWNQLRLLINWRLTEIVATLETLEDPKAVTMKKSNEIARKKGAYSYSDSYSRKVHDFRRRLIKKVARKSAEQWPPFVKIETLETRVTLEEAMADDGEDDAEPLNFDLETEEPDDNDHVKSLDDHEHDDVVSTNDTTESAFKVEIYSEPENVEGEDDDDDVEEIKKTKKYHEKCKFCSKEFPRGIPLQNHEMIHTGEKPYECDICGYRFRQKATCTRHKINAHSDKTKKNNLKRFHCQQCPRAFRYNADLQRHQVLHSGEKPFKCEQCGKQFSWDAGLRIHRRRYGHAGDDQKIPVPRPRPKKKTKIVPKVEGEPEIFICRFCGKEFAKRPYLRNHELTHTAEKPFQCSTCGRRFRQKSSCKRHEETAHWKLHGKEKGAEKRFPCATCGKCFRFRSDVLNHEVLHSGEKPFKCDICGMAFVWQQGLKHHQRKKHGPSTSSENLKKPS